MSDWPIITEGMPDTTGAVLAGRLIPKYEMKTRFDPVWAALAGAGAIPAGLAAAALGNVGLGAAVAAGGALAAAASVRTERTLVCPPPLAKKFGDAWVLYNWLAKSPNKTEREHICLGTIHGLPYDVPLLISLKLLKSHLLGLGATRSSKTQRLIMPILRQLLERRDASIILLDGKGDRAAVNMLRTWAEKFGIPFRFFSLDPRIPGHLYCLFRDPAWKALLPNERAQVLTRAFALEQSESSSEGYWSAKNREPLTSVLERCDVASFAEIHERLSDKRFRKLRLGVSDREFDAASHLMSCLKDRSRIPQADATSADGLPESYFEHAISIERALTEPCLFYFYLPFGLNPVGCRYIAREVMYHTTTRARTLPRTGRPHLYIVGEEAKTFVQTSL